MGHANRSFAIIGLGTFGSTVATELVRFGHHVLGIDSNEKRVSQMANTLSEALIADGTDELAMREASIGHYDVVLIAMGEDLEASILCTLNAKTMGVKTVWVKAISRTHHRILSKLGANRIVHPEQEMGQQIAQMLHNPLIHDYVNLDNGYYMVNLAAPEQLHGKTLADLHLKETFNIRCLGFMRGVTYFEASDTTPALQTGDKLLLLGKRTALRQFSNNL